MMSEINDLLLVNPPWVKKRGNIWRKVAGTVPPLGLAALAASAERAGARVSIIDAQALGLDEDETAEEIGRRPARIIGFTATTPIVNGAYRLAERASSDFPESRIIFGGPHVTALPDEALSKLPGAVVVRGEGDVTIVEMLSSEDWSGVAGVSLIKDGEARHNAVPELVDDLDSLPEPAYHLLPLGRYTPSLGNYRRTPALGIIATRGCYGRCAFCYRETFGNRVRSLSVGRVVSELKHLRERRGIRDVQFYDDIFLGNKRAIREFCEVMISERPDVIWLCNLRAELTSPELLGLMRRAGCYMVDYGVESGDEDVLRGMKKNAALERTMECVAMAKKAGLDIKCGFMIGSPGETAETMKATLTLAIRLAPDTAMFNITTPFPGTDIFKEASSGGDVTTLDWDLYDYSHVILKSPCVTAEAIEDFYKTVYRRFYLRPSYIAGRILKLRSWRNLGMAARAFFAIMGLVFFERRRSAA